MIYPFDLVLPSEFGYWIVYTEDSINRPKVQAFRDWLKAEAGPPTRKRTTTTKRPTWRSDEVRDGRHRDH